MRFGFFLVMLLATVPVQAQELDDPIQLALNTNFTLPASLAPAAPLGRYERPESKKEQAPAPAKPDIDYSLFDLDFRRPTHFPDYWNTYANQRRYSYRADYKGLHGLIYKQITRACNRLYRQYSNDYWEQQQLMDPNFDQSFRRFKLFEADFHDRWWDREFFFDHLPVEKGGISERTYTVGRDCEVVSLGPLALNNSGKVSWSGWRLNVAHRRERDIDRRFDIMGNELPRNRVNDRALEFGISPPRGNIYTADKWTLSGSMRANLRMGALENNGSTLRGRLDFIAYMGHNPQPWLGVTVDCSARPLRNEYRAAITIALLRW